MENKFPSLFSSLSMLLTFLTKAGTHTGTHPSTKNFDRVEIWEMNTFFFIGV